MHRSIALLFGGAALLACGDVRPDAEQRRLGAELARMTREVEAARFTRPIPRGAAPTAPAFGPAFEARVAERKLLSESSDAAQRCITDLDAAVPGSVEACAEKLAPTDAAFAALLDTGASTSPGAPRGMSGFGPSTREIGVGRSLLALAKHGGARAALAVARTDPAAGALVCVRTLEVVRDAVAGSNMIGAMTAATAVKLAAKPCEKAIASSPQDVASKRREDVVAVTSTLPPFSWFVDAEMIGIQLASCGWTVGPEERASLSEGARATVTESDAERARYGWNERRASWTACRNGFTAMSTVAKSYRAPRGSTERRRLAEAGVGDEDDGVATRLGGYEEQWDRMLGLLAALAKE